ncbi:MAG TPA: peptidase S10 [Bacteroidia bacterium]|jgi:carboxypeptidase C (cathepsin A)|nr:peptidase S10 [Bacteroidia bacterium]
MKKSIYFSLLFLVSAGVTFSNAQTHAAVPHPSHRDSLAPGKNDSVPAPVVTHHHITIDGKTINYTATAGYMPSKDKDESVKAKIFYIAYTADGESAGKRPVTFVFNGGPGSSSIWLHMGAISPVRVHFADDKGTAPAPPYSYGDNENSWISFTDLVFIDPVSTGFSRTVKGVEPAKFHGYSEDIASVGDFIRMYTTRNDRWGSPKFLTGESYGTTRASGLSGYLQNTYGMYLNGITLVSSVLNFEYIDFNRGNDLPYALFLPTYATTAQFYNKLSPELQKISVSDLAKKVETFASGTYTYFLMKGDLASGDLTNKVIDSLSYFTGLSKNYIRNSNERIRDHRFFKEILRDESKTVGRYDSRYTGEDADDAGEGFSYDPSYSAVSGLFNGVFNEYVRKDLNYKSDLPYEALTNVWPWQFPENSYLDVSETLRGAMTENSALKVMVCCGYYDLATPFYNAEYAVNHMGLRPDVRNNITLNYYNAGHMMYLTKDDDAKLKADAMKFYQSAIK